MVFFCCVHCSRDFKWFSMRLTTPKLAPSCRRMSTLSNTWFLGSTRVYPPSGISIGSAVLQGSRTWSTDKPCYSVCSNRPHIDIAAMRPKKVNRMTMSLMCLRSCMRVGVGIVCSETRVCGSWYVFTHAGCIVTCVGKAFSRVCISACFSCLFVCLHSKRKTSWAINVKLGTCILCSIDRHALTQRP